MSERFADTFFFIALLSPSDEAHQRATQIGTAWNGTLVTTAWVLTELADGLADSSVRGRVPALIRELEAQTSTLVIKASQDHFDRGLTLYAQRPDKEWSLTDCISFVVMHDRGIREALTGDHHFEQAGFVALLK
jgi:uncharacterized protein